MPATLSQQQIAYLVELMNPHSGEIEEVDICAKLELAVEMVKEHLAEFTDSLIEVEVSFDSDDVIEGIGFFDEDHEMLSCITTYHLDRDTDSARAADIAQACRGDKFLLQAELNRIFRN